MHRVSIRMLFLLAAPLALAVLAVASTSSGGTTRASSVSRTAASHTLRTAFSADPSPLDPDTYYEAEGLLITTSAYEGLLRYKPNSPTLEGLLATSWKKSANGLTYTFQLRHGVRFSDGTPFNAAAAKWSFQRRIALKGGPSYMLANVKSMSTPGPYTFVVKLRRPTDPFLDYLASPYGPLMSSPTADKQHAKGKDLGSAWLASHTAGTGPYVLSSVQRATKYELTSNSYYWGAKPYFTTVDISVVPDFSTQEIELKGGQLDMVMHGLTTEDITALEHDSNVQVKNFPALFKAQVWVNPKSGVFADPSVRAALRSALNNRTLTQQIYGDRAVPSTQFYPAGMLPVGTGTDRPAYNPNLLKKALAPYKGKSVTVGWYADGAMQRLADLLQVQLQAAGLHATTQTENPAVLFALPTKPSQRPDLVTAAFNPDAASPDTWAQVYTVTNAPVNLLGCSVKNADALETTAAAQANHTAAVKLYGKAADAYRKSNCWLNISDVRDTIVARKGITGWDHQLPWVFVTRLASLREQ